MRTAQTRVSILSTISLFTFAAFVGGTVLGQQSCARLPHLNAIAGRVLSQFPREQAQVHELPVKRLGRHTQSDAEGDFTKWFEHGKLSFTGDVLH